jgi:hypothetical protein
VSDLGNPTPRTMVKSDARVHIRMQSHIGFTNPAHVYCGM